VPIGYLITVGVVTVGMLLAVACDGRRLIGRRRLAAWDAGGQIVGSTLSGYTSAQASSRPDGPDLQLVQTLAAAVARVMGEGRYSTQDDVRLAFDAGAWCVVIGTAITDPIEITKRLVEGTPAPPTDGG
jgi:N-acylglucosamine-6-phosphate 2-epimerase